MRFYQDWLGVLLMIRPWDCVLLGRKTTAKCRVHHSISRGQAVARMITIRVVLDNLPVVCLSVSPPWSFSPLPSLAGHCYVLKEWRVTFPHTFIFLNCVLTLWNTAIRKSGSKVCLFHCISWLSKLKEFLTVVMVAGVCESDVCQTYQIVPF